MEWKPKSSQKHGVIGPQPTGTTAVNLSSDADNTVGAKVDETILSQRLSQVNIENVIIPQHFRVSETERSRLTFGSFGAGFDSMNSPSSFHAYGNGEYSNHESHTSVPVSVPESSAEDASFGDQAYSQDGQTRASQSGSPAPASPLEPQSSEKIDSSSPQSMEEYANIGLVQSDSPSYSPAELQQLQNPAFLPSFSVNDPQTTNDMVFFRMPMDENMRIQGLSSVSEALSSQPFTNTGATSSVAMVQQQQMAQPYPQLHISHYPNLMQYRQFISPVFVPPMATLHNYSGNPAYPHPSNASSYVLMPPGGNSHLPAGIKYGTSQYKPVAAPSPTGYGNYTSPAGYAISAPGAVGAATGLDDMTRMKYKDNSLYVPNPQVETSEIWLQNPRDIQSMQTTPYYNIPGQAPHPAYMPTHAGHASFNAAVPQSSHMQFPGGYHPQQPGAIANPHSLVHQQVPGMVGNVGMGVAGPATAQVGAAFQPSSQLGHLSWTGNF
ncbi:hypothetical protein QJS04_geneDACA004953 [Acorus gramineus]|uniref:GBF-interacting protein 1 N-terminal domain-containing protein n=1 Tax=Acorus gramineus TaxID=55184 RepID=A0AAV9BZH0_ACOGR|nr:hypothetical protein QJS04_geneDACA004953 [Acorus gramineus]